MHHSTTKPSQIWTSKSLDFECVLNVDVGYLSFYGIWSRHKITVNLSGNLKKRKTILQTKIRKVSLPKKLFMITCSVQDLWEDFHRFWDYCLHLLDGTLPKHWPEASSDVTALRAELPRMISLWSWTLPRVILNACFSIVTVKRNSNLNL